MKRRILFFAVITLLAYGCGNNKEEINITLLPDAGTTYKAGDDIGLQINYPAGIKIDSVVYLMDSARVGTVHDSSVVHIKTDSMSLGARVITAKVYQPGKSDELTTNIVLLAAKAPEQLTFKVEKIYPHDTSLYTEGLVYDNNSFYESGGGYLQPPAGEPVDGPSLLAKTDLATGRILKKATVDPKVFAEGIVVVGNKITQLTWKEKIGYVYDKDTFKLLNTFNNNVGVEGWGMCFDGTKIYMDDSTNRIWFLDKDNYRAIGFIDVFDDKGPVNQINELEMINGKLYANVYQTDDIIVIDPKTGAVLQRIDMSNLYPKAERNKNADVLNGIAYDKAGNRIFVTGKKWDKLFQVRFVKP
ncbi:glutaminyl-peptide cyclotransferase [Mucilaginibacter segetis]|uniref:Glutaminyl-peptide cyclotransferase n=1 Tax=Mucilaginibacter segetis TaxID=2793071 RepID=A0A934PYA0_9SPHI|nr:glutaminyl-peptide cyclotransferase [Mucilaginibacter segetis]MBK0381281.1 glutaminyl-peptide cyclotransferase [Mucilaginibacter segetis]